MMLNTGILFLILQVLVLMSDSGGSTQIVTNQSEGNKAEKGGNILNEAIVELSDPKISSINDTNKKMSTDCSNCVFPFVFNGEVYQTCTTVDGDDPWCSTKVDMYGTHISNRGHYEYCTSSACPGIDNPTMKVHPDNQVGKCYCGIPNTMDGSRIVGGMETEIGEYPWQVALLWSKNIASQKCGGTLVSDRHVVTAAHCTDGNTASELYVAIGDNILGDSSETTSFIVRVKHIHQHRGYVRTTFQNDISLLELKKAIDLTAHPNIKPICLPAQGKTYENRFATVSGWGSVGSGGPSPSHLHEVDVKIFADRNCGVMTSSMTRDMICAGFMAGEKDSCQGDSGGPLFLPDQANNGAQTLVGVVSWGRGCGEPGQPGIYSEVSHFRNWLDAKMGNFETCSSKSGMTGSPATCGDCVFPFKYQGTTYHTCTTAEWDHPWCSTKNDIYGNHLEQFWEWCSSETCPRNYNMETGSFSSSNITTPAATATTTAPNCWRKGSIPALKLLKSINGIPNVQTCRDECIQEPVCDFYKWKNNKNINKRVCFLQSIKYIKKNNFYGGPRVC